MSFYPSGKNGLRIYILDKPCSNNPVPLKSVDVDVSIKGYIANVTAVLVYKNAEEDAIEVIYKFPIDEASAVYRFEAEVDGRVIIGECQERQLAKEMYQEALNNGHNAAILEQTDYISDIFSIMVGNIPPGGEVKITFGYVTELSLLAESGVTRFTLHTILNPRYNPAPEAGGQANPPKESYIEGGKQPYNFNFRAKVGDSGPISNIVSAKDDLKVEYNTEKTEASVNLAKPFVTDHDLTLDISYTDPFKPHVIIEKGVATEEGFLKEDLVMLNFLPELKASDCEINTTSNEFIIIIDRSGSMDGPRIESASETLLLFLKSLPMGCYFNIIGFGSYFDKLFPEGSRELSEESLKAAMLYQQRLQANFGGTSILEPLEDVYSTPVMTTHSRQLFLLTDGEVSNTNEIISTVQKNASHTRVFTFGIGEGASTALVKGVARAGRGRAEFIKEGDRMQAIVMKTLKAAGQPNITDIADVHLEWNLKGSPKLIQIPSVLPTLFSGDRLIVYAVSSGQAVLDGKVHLKVKIGQRELDFDLDVHSGQVKNSEDGTLPLHRLAVKSQIQQLQEEDNNGYGENNKEAIILLSTASNIVSQYTSMIAVDKEKSVKVTGQRTVRQVPRLVENFRCPDGRSPFMKYKGRILVLNGRACFSLRGGSSESTSSPRNNTETEDEEVVAQVFTGYMAVIQLQTFCGSWKLDSDLEKVLEMNLEKIKSSQPQKISDEVWATLLALAVLNMKYSDNKDEWEMIEIKAQQWLNTQQLQNHSLSFLLDLAKAAVKN